MKRTLTLLWMGAALLSSTVAQAEDLEVKPTAKVFAEYHYVVSDDDGANGFELTRVYMGLKAALGETLKFKLVSDVGHQSSYAWDGTDVVENKESGKFEFFMKNAYATYQPFDFLGVSLGLVGSPWTGFIDDAWRYRYVSKSMTDRYKFENTADLGLAVHGAIPGGYGDYEVGVYNGEGYKKPETGPGKQLQGRLALTPLPFVAALERLTLAGSFSYESVKTDDSATAADEGVAETLIGGLVHYAYAISDDFGVSLGVQLAVGSTQAEAGSVDRQGLSLFGEVALPGHAALFGRFDRVDPDTDAAAENDVETLILGGLSYAPVKYVAMALDVAVIDDEAPATDAETVVTLHTQFSF